MLVANARKTRLIYANKRKTDEVDAENLARLARLDPKLLYPLKHRGENSQAHLAIIRSRAGVGRLPHAAGEPRSRSGQVLRSSLAQMSGEELPQEGRRAHPRGAFAGSRARLGVRSARSPSASGTTTGSWRQSPKSTTQKPSCCARSKGSDRSRRSPSCSPWKIPTASKGVAPWALIWG